MTVVDQETPCFRATGLTKVYRTGEVEVHALRGIDLTVAQGEIVTFLGPSGSGKSTLLNILGGIDRPSAGQVYFRDQELTRFDDRAMTAFRRHHVGFVFQFYNLTANENVGLVTDIARDPMAAEDALQIVGLGERVDHFPAQLSGGEQQRVAIARAIAKRPDILLCDEPTGALDSKTGIVVLEAIAKANQELNTTVAVITHNAPIAKMGDRTLHFADGQIVNEERNAERVDPMTMSW